MTCWWTLSLYCYEVNLEWDQVDDFDTLRSLSMRRKGHCLLWVQVTLWTQRKPWLYSKTWVSTTDEHALNEKVQSIVFCSLYSTCIRVRVQLICILYCEMEISFILMWTWRRFSKRMRSNEKRRRIAWERWRHKAIPTLITITFLYFVTKFITVSIGWSADNCHAEKNNSIGWWVCS